jgi:hypothetical protein
MNSEGHMSSSVNLELKEDIKNMKEKKNSNPFFYTSSFHAIIKSSSMRLNQSFTFSIVK